MTIIRRLNCFDAPKIKKMIAYLGSNEKYSRAILTEAFHSIHSVLPLQYKFLPESYILLENNEILGLITTAPTNGNPYKINITRLIFKQNMYDIGKQLVEYVVAKYGAKGAISFRVLVDQCHEELLSLFVDGCGFRHCSYENLWKLDKFEPKLNEILPFRHCQNSDAKQIAKLYNAELKNLYKPSLERTKSEYFEPVFAGMTKYYKNRYVLENFETNKIIAYLSITTSDNYNFIIDMSLNDVFNIPYDGIINYALSQIRIRKSKFCAFLKHRQYTNYADEMERYLHERNLNCIQTQCVLIKDFYKQIKQPEKALQLFQFGEVSSTN